MVNCNKYKGDIYTNCVKQKKEAAKMNRDYKKKTIAAKKIDPEDSNNSVLNEEVGINEKGDFDNIERRTIQDETVPAAKLASSSGGKTKRRSKKSKKSKKKRRTRRKGKKSRKSRK